MVVVNAIDHLNCTITQPIDRVVLPDIRQNIDMFWYFLRN